MSVSSSAVSGRSQAVDLTKTLAICGVLLIHVSAGGLAGASVGFSAWTACLLDLWCLLGILYPTVRTLCPFSLLGAFRISGG